MYHVYILRSVKFKKQIYVGFTENLEERLKSHNYGQVPYTAKFKPWEFVTHVTFQNKEKAVAFEKYLKSGSGRQFSYKHLI